MASETTRRRLVATGRVQGVGFRRYVERQALAHDLAGWVRNRDDGAVEMEVEGTASAVASFRRLVQHGPPGSRVTQLHDEPSGADGALPHPFTIRRQ